MKSSLSDLLDHPIFHCLLNLVPLIPGGKWLQRGRSTTGAMNDPALITEWAASVRDLCKAAGFEIANQRLLEVGPGHSLGVAVCLLAAGAARVTCVDVVRYADPGNFTPLELVLGAFIERGFAKNPEPLSALLRHLEYRVVTGDTWPVADSSIDVVYSFFSAEHYRDPRRVLREIRRTLRPGGLCIQEIDLHDHYHWDDNWLHCLYYEPYLWELMSSRRGRWTNRIRAPQWRELFGEQFDVVAFEETRLPLPRDFEPERLASPFRMYELDTLSIHRVRVVARRPVSSA